MNPYTAVPQALQESRRTLRDIITDMAETRAMQSKLQLAMAQQKGELELAAAKRQMEQEEKAADRALEEEKLASIDRYRKGMLGIYDKKYGGGDLATVRSRIEKAPLIASDMKEMLLDVVPDDLLDQEISDDQKDELWKNLLNHDSFTARNIRGLMIEDLNKKQAQIQNPDSRLSLEQLDKLGADYRSTFEKLKLFDLAIGNSRNLTPEDDKKIRIWAAKEAQKTGEKFEDIYDSMVSEITKLREVVHPEDFEKSFINPIKEELAKTIIQNDDRGNPDNYVPPDSPESAKSSSAKATEPGGSLSSPEELMAQTPPVREKAAAKPSLRELLDPGRARRTQFKNLFLKGAERFGRTIKRKREIPLSDIMSRGQEM